MSDKATDTAWSSLSNGVDLWVGAVNDGVEQWLRAVEKASKLKYGPNDAAQDMQQAFARAARLSAQMTQFWTLGWLGWGSTDAARAVAREEIQAQFKRAQAAAYNDKLAPKPRAEAVSQFYSEDVRWLVEGAPTIEGREQMKAMWEFVFNWKELDFEYHATHLEVALAGDMAWEIGTMRMSGTPPGGKFPRIEFDGRYAVVWEKRDGEWLMTLDIQNSKTPVMPVPPQKAAAAKTKGTIKISRAKKKAAKRSKR